MPTISEIIGSREWSRAQNATGGADKVSVTLRYRVDGTSDDIVAHNFLLDNTGSTYDGFLRQAITVEPLENVDTVGDTGTWDCTVLYISPEDKAEPADETAISFDTTGGTSHITQSINPVARYSATGKNNADTPEYKGAINVTHDAVNGVDIVVPAFKFSETHIQPLAAFLGVAELENDEDAWYDYRGKLFAMTGTVNSGAFRGTLAGEILFLGASGSKRGQSDDWTITFAFALSPNKTDLVVSTITNIEKDGWEFLWIRYQDEEDTSAKSLVKLPKFAYVEQVYFESDFAQLGIGVN